MDRRRFVLGAGMAACSPLLLAENTRDFAAYETPYKYGQLIVEASGVAGSFDEKSVDDPIVFRVGGKFYMLYIGFDGVGYQTGLAESRDLVEWKKLGCVAKRDADSKWTKFNVALSSILRDKRLHGRGDAVKVGGKYMGAWNAYPSAGYESGAAVIGLAWSKDLLHWELGEPILFPQDGAAWEHGGLYRPDLLFDDGTYYLYYNAKTDKLSKAEGGGWREQTGVATSKDLKTWTRYAGNPVLRNGGEGSRDSRFASNPFVVRHGKQWGMYYFGLAPHEAACELLAVGDGPFDFVKAPEVLIDAGAKGTVDETFAHKPCVIFHEGALWHFYCAVSGKWPNEVRGISVARSRAWRLAR